MNTALIVALSPFALRALAEAGFYVADVCGKKKSKKAKITGQIAWNVGKVCSLLVGLSDAYAKKKYQVKP